MLQIDGDHRQASTGKLVSYRVDLDEGFESTNYAARVLLAREVWHELEAGTVAGPDPMVRTPEVIRAVCASIDRLDLDALNRG